MGISHRELSAGSFFDQGGAISEFLFPARLIVRRGASADLPTILDTIPVDADVFVVADPILRSLGVIDPITTALKNSGRGVVVFDRIVGEPQAADVQAGIDLARSSASGIFVGIGGGSALDGAKMIALGSRLSQSIEEVSGKQEELDSFPPLVLIPTTTGTGSEATRVAMYAVNGTKRAILSTQFVPAIAVLDADLVAALPAPIVAATALDALAHAVESMMSTVSNPLTELFAVEAARLIIENLPAAQAPDGQSARGLLLYASFLSGVALNAGVVVGHSLSYVIAGQHGLSHGVGCALALPYCIAYNSRMSADRGRAIARRLLDDDEADLEQLSRVTRQLAEEAGLPVSLAELPTPVAPAEEMATTLVTNYPRPTNPVPLDPGLLAALFSRMVHGDLDGAWKDLK